MRYLQSAHTMLRFKKKEIKADNSITDQFCQIAGNPAKLIEVLRHKGRFLKPIIFWRI